MAPALHPQFKLRCISEDNVAPLQDRVTSEMAMTVPAGMTITKYCEYIQAQNLLLMNEMMWLKMCNETVLYNLCIKI